MIHLLWRRNDGEHCRKCSSLHQDSTVVKQLSPLRIYTNRIHWQTLIKLFIIKTQFTRWGTDRKNECHGVTIYSKILIILMVRKVCMECLHCNIHYTYHIIIFLSSKTQIKHYLLQFKDPLLKTFMDILLETSFMRSGTTSDMRIGHINEPIIMNNAMTLCTPGQQTLTHFKINFVSSVGLAQKSSFLYLHASLDFIIAENNYGDKHVMFAEVKCRTRKNTIQRETRLSTERNKWILVIAGDKNCYKYVQTNSERMQLLYQAATLDLNKGVLLIGNNKGHIIRGIRIKCPTEIIDSYNLCINDVHHLNNGRLMYFKMLILVNG